MSNNKGFTLIEMVVVLAVVAILAAILTPTIAKNLNDAKIARANNEVQVIAGALGSFYKDVGRWPTSNGAAASLPDVIQLLYGDGTAPTVTAADDKYWIATGWGAALSDTFANHLILNDPKGAANNYSVATTSELRWRGPYITEIKPDPWGCHYSCNIYYTYNTTTNMVGVWSAGPDRTAATLAIQPSSTAVIAGDDILYRLQ